jgi:uncharacterized protein (DUF1810 family)
LSDDTSLDRFIQAQQSVYEGALREIGAGRKRSHWMWFIFPQIDGLGRSETARFYAIRSRDEAMAYAGHPLLGTRLRTCVAALGGLPTADAVAVFGEVDAAKLRSSLTLFEAATGEPLFSAAIDRWFAGSRDERTLQLLRSEPAGDAPAG